MKRLSVTLILLVICLLLAGAWWIHGNAPVNLQDKTQKSFNIQKGEPLREIANRLQTNGLIRDPIVFFLVVKQNGLDNKIEAGDFNLSSDMSAKQIAEALTKGTMEVWITIPEGYRATEIAALLKQKFAQYDPLWQPELQQYEGYLFPDTYQLSKDTTIEDIISTMHQNFDKKYASIASSQTNQKNIVIVASLIEREAKYPEDRPLVASVIYNRLNAGMPLQIDATIQYALGYQQAGNTWWKKDLTTNDLAISSPFNTYTQTGLPPTPISNPGIEALKAAINPAKTNYLYYVSDSTGHNHYATTLAEHNANIKKYGL
ncbi:MAG TPA: endolytic transglycosylase MltG [Patescibacteria group bacterium]|nr:endolytic transglycosylase MltG [Patescibacteria group bacterium]